MKISSTIILFILIFSTTSAIPKLCKYRGRQLTKGQTITDCYASVTCTANGEIKIKNPCPVYNCTKLSMRRGYKRFDPKKPYPNCCGGPICADGQISFYGSASAYIPKKILRRSPHVMGIKFA
ncbi:hypothetical protein KPH14_004424 [Odynerus spinipes]|uniref:Single domain-containing protein n=1 Tax=Odynerus spinipes TaxID=1348599 RepID=A0AAD9VWG2_9HYME|nr:hypothetical protein KPH14_004424 [Odynerus spinipes]